MSCKKENSAIVGQECWEHMLDKNPKQLRWCCTRPPRWHIWFRTCNGASGTQAMYMYVYIYMFQGEFDTYSFWRLGNVMPSYAIEIDCGTCRSIFEIVHHNISCDFSSVVRRRTIWIVKLFQAFEHSASFNLLWSRINRSKGRSSAKGKLDISCFFSMKIMLSRTLQIWFEKHTIL